MSESSTSNLVQSFGISCSYVEGREVEKKHGKEGRKMKKGKRTDVGQTGKNVGYLRGRPFPRLNLFIYIEKSTKRGRDVLPRSAGDGKTVFGLASSSISSTLQSTRRFRHSRVATLPNQDTLILLLCRHSHVQSWIPSEEIHRF